jgi:hypothetical protein
MNIHIQQHLAVLWIRHLFLMLFVVTSTFLVCGQESIVYSGEIGKSLGDGSVDVDKDGMPEFRFDVSPVHHIPGMVGEVYSAHIPSGSGISIEGMVYGESLRLLDFGSQIGDSMASGDWSSRDLQLPVLFVLHPNFTPFEYVASGPLAEAGSPAFIGMRVVMPDGVHYGWAQLTVEDADRPRAVLVDWAFETRPEIPIVAGVVPEPAVSRLMVAGGALLIGTRRYRPRHRWVEGPG